MRKLGAEVIPHVERHFLRRRPGGGVGIGDAGQETSRVIEKMADVCAERASEFVEAHQALGFVDDLRGVPVSGFAEETEFQPVHEQEHQREILVRVGAARGHPFEETAALLGLDAEIGGIVGGRGALRASAGGDGKRRVHDGRLLTKERIRVGRWLPQIEHP
jgi:hypothetical protein